MAASSPRTSLSLLKRLCDPADAEAWRRLVQLYTPLLQRWLRGTCRLIVASGSARTIT